MSQHNNELRVIVEDPDYVITLSDGCRLSARVWMPRDAGEVPVPIILEYLPYRKRDGTCARDALTHPWFAERGYACVRVDIRGNGDSEGVMEDEYSPQELEDAVEVIAHLAAQDWCNGNVGMMGISWGGFNGLQVAAMQPDALKAVITLCSTVDRYADDIHYKGGCLLNENLGWGATMWAYSSRAPDPALRENWRELWLQRLRAEPFLASVWLRHQNRDAYWEHGSIIEDYSALKAKVLSIGGWGDSYKNAVPQIVAALPGAKGIIGPWVHKYPHFAVPEPRIGFLQEALRWWDRWLKGIDTGVEHDPPLRVYQMDSVRPATWYAQRDGGWLATQQMQSGAADGPKTNFALGANRTLSVADKATVIDATVKSPADCGADGGEYCAIWLGPEMPGDQRSDDALSTTWDSVTLDQAIQITGAPHLSLQIKSDKPDAQIAVRLCHVHPDGASTRITYGVRNLARSVKGDTATALPIGVAVDRSIDMDHIAYTVPAGHRLRVSISNAYWPLLWPSPEQSELTVTGGLLNIPHVVAEGGTVAFLPPEAATPWETETIRPENHIRRREVDMNTGTVSLIIEDDFGKAKDSDHGMVSGSIAREVWSIHPDDPLSARGHCHWTEEVERGDIRLRTETTSAMSSDATDFHLTARLEAYENDVLIYERDVKDTVPRDRM